MPRVSVILTSFNHEKYLREAIESALGQTFADFELIAWDDASTDASWAVINSYQDRRIKAFRNETNRRPIYGVLKAITDVASGEYIALHHSDDVWRLDKLEKQVAFLDSHPQIGAVFSDALAIGEDSSPLADEKHFYAHIFQQPNRTRHEWLRFFFGHGNALCHPSVLIRKDCYTKCGAYRYGFGQLGDLDMWIRLCLKYDIHVMPEKLVNFRVRNNEANTSGSRPETRIQWAYEFHNVVQNYRALTRFEDLVKVFPAAKKFDRNDATDAGFALAMMALEERSFGFAPLFGLDLLFEIISDPKRSTEVRRLYGFGYENFVAMTGRHDFSSGDGIARRDGVIDALNADLAAKRAEIERIKSTASWQLTKPLRLCWNAISKTLRLSAPRP
jgi:glycosyltransferase involved in cell wall biosynthesis